MALDRAALPVLVIGGAVVLYVVYAGRWSQPSAGGTPPFNTAVPSFLRIGSQVYTRPGQAGAPVNPLVQAGSGLAKLVGALFGGSSSSSEATPADTGRVSTADILRSSGQLPGDLVVVPPDILASSVSGTTNDPSNPGTFFGSDPVLTDNAPALDQSSSFDSQAGGFAFT